MFLKLLNRIPTWLQPILLAIVSLLLLLVAITPMPKSIYLLQITIHASSSLLHSGISDSIRFGVWGYCSSGLDASIFGITHDSAGGCSPHRLGYQIDQSVAKALHVDALATAISTGLSAILGLNIVDCICAFAALCIYVVPVILRHANRPLGSEAALRFRSVFTILTATACATTWLALIFDAVFLSMASSKIGKIADNLVQVTRGNAIWLTFVSAIILTIVVAWDRRVAAVRMEEIKLNNLTFDSNRFVGISIRG